MLIAKATREVKSQPTPAIGLYYIYSIYVNTTSSPVILVHVLIVMVAPRSVLNGYILR